MVEYAGPCNYRIMDVLLWIIVAVALGVAEIFTTTLFLLMFSAGALAAAAAAGLGASVPVQGGVFVVVSALTLAAVRPALRRHLGSRNVVGMGTATMQGAAAVVVEHVDTEHGMVRIDGELWQARALEGFGTYVPGERVRIVDVSDGTVLVWRDDLPGISDTEN
ncbi:membrane protein implicated in regulation of membrane protease activity [Actinoplanes italicus]|uniref:Membrane protein implicated in regulation of membrane protease activity n=2 Tax=Actinoplanes italicus TaxID=113567 RepID=A0A2T0KHW9_9ACTN|nr:membrane protein implicated in regulation of membrane protease activity [Actinoplanes italicus]